jgi:hypothetical protein
VSGCACSGYAEVRNINLVAVLKAHYRAHTQVFRVDIHVFDVVIMDKIGCIAQTAGKGLQGEDIGSMLDINITTRYYVFVYELTQVSLSSRISKYGQSFLQCISADHPYDMRVPQTLRVFHFFDYVFLFEPSIVRKCLLCKRGPATFDAVDYC